MSIARLSNPDRSILPPSVAEDIPLRLGRAAKGQVGTATGRAHSAQRRTTLATGNVRGLEEIGTEQFKPGWVSRTFQDARCLTPFRSVGRQFRRVPRQEGC
jgi:hypothetical protein